MGKQKSNGIFKLDNLKIKNNFKTNKLLFILL